MANIDHVFATRILNVLQRGVSAGSLANNTLRSANRVAFNAAIAESLSAGYLLWVPPVRYEIHGGALLMVSDGIRWVGTKGSTIVQYQLNIPVIHVGPPLGTSGASSISGVNIDGATLMYNGVGTAGANALEMTGGWLCIFRNLDIGDPNAPFGSRSSVPYCGIYWDGSDGTLPPFSNYYENIRVKHFVWRGISLERNQNGGDGENTGNVFVNIYVSGGGAHGGGSGQQDLSGVSGGGMFHATGHSELRLEQINFEWCTTPYAMFLNNCHGVDISSMHIEGVELKNSSTDRGGFLQFYNSKVNVQSPTLYDSYCKSANNIDSAALFLVGPGTRLTFDNVRIKAIQRNGTDFSVVRSWGYGPIDDVRVSAGLIDFAEGTNEVDRYDTFAYATPGQALYGSLADFSSDMPQTLSDASVTHYAYCSAGILLMAPSTTRTLTLSRYLRSSDSIVLPQGVRRRVRRNGGAGTLTVANGGAGGGTFTVANGVTIDLVFDGTNWIQVS